MFNVELPFYSIMILLSLIVNIIIVVLISKRYNFDKREIVCLLLYENVGIIYGAKILKFLQKYNELDGQFNFISLGLTSYGAIIGALLFLILFSVQFKKSFREILYIFMPSMPLMYAVGKIGCFLAGCCGGIPLGPTKVFPVQLTETIIFSCVFIYMIRKHIQNQFDLKVIGVSSILCGSSKFFLDFFRKSHIGLIVSFNQVISVFFIIIGIIIVIIINKIDNS